MKTFIKARTASDMLLLKVDSVERGSELTVPAAYYPEAFYRMRVSMSKEADLYSDQAEIVKESTGLFWDSCTNAQILLEGQAEGCEWILSLHRFGALRWQLSKSGKILASMESNMLSKLLDARKPMLLGLSLRFLSGTMQASLLIGQDYGMMEEVRCEESLDFSPLAHTLSVGCGRNNVRPFCGAIEELLVANTVRYQLYDRPETCAAIESDFPCSSVLAPYYVSDDCISVLPGVEFAKTNDHYWYYFKLCDSAVRRIIIEEVSGMCDNFFVSEDQDTWTPLPLASLGLSASGKKTACLDVSQYSESVYIASAPVYAERERDRDLEKAKALGCTVQEVSYTDLGRPLHVVSLTNDKVVLAGKKAVILHCGQHAPLEQTGGLLGMPCIEELLKIDTENNILDRFIFYWVPIFNVDCAHFGSPGNDVRCTNPNRHWQDDRTAAHIGLQEFFVAEAGKGVEMRYLLDVHMGGWRNHTVLPYYKIEASESQSEIDLENLSPEGERNLPIVQGLLDYCGIRERWNNTWQAGNANSCAPWFQVTFNAPAMVVEGSVATYFDPETQRTLPFTVESFERLGRNFARLITSDIILGTH